MNIFYSDQEENLYNIQKQYDDYSSASIINFDISLQSKFNFQNEEMSYFLEENSINKYTITDDHSLNHFPKPVFKVNTNLNSSKENKEDTTITSYDMNSNELSSNTNENNERFIKKRRKKEKDEKIIIPNIELMTKEEVKMEKNRLSAKRSREKQKKRFEELEEINKELKLENVRLYQEKEKLENKINSLSNYIQNKSCKECKTHIQKNIINIINNSFNNDDERHKDTDEYYISTSSSNNSISSISKLMIMVGIICIVSLYGSFLSKTNEKSIKRQLIEQENLTLLENGVSEEEIKRRKEINHALSLRIETNRKESIFKTHQDLRKKNELLNIKYNNIYSIQEMEEKKEQLKKSHDRYVLDLMSDINYSIYNALESDTKENKRSKNKEKPKKEKILLPKIENNQYTLYEAIAKNIKSMYVLNFIQNEDIFEFIQNISNANRESEEGEFDDNTISNSTLIERNRKYLFLIIENPIDKQEKLEIRLQIMSVKQNRISN